MNKRQAAKKGRKKSRKGFNSGAVLGAGSSLGAILRRRDVRRVTGLSDTTIWRLENAGKFPRRIQLTEHTIGWDENAVRRWRDSRPFADDAEHKGQSAA